MQLGMGEPVERVRMETFVLSLRVPETTSFRREMTVTYHVPIMGG